MFLNASGQHKVEVFYEQDSNGNYTFYGLNKDLCTNTIAVNFIVLDNLKASMPLPYIGALPPGKSSLFTLSPKYPTRSASFRYDYTYTRGCLSNRVNFDFSYLLPVSPTKEVEVFELSPLETFFGKDDYTETWYALGFKMSDNDTIFAARSGLVIDVQDKTESFQTNNIFSRDENYIEVFHKDCTIGRYQVMKKGSAMVKVGQNIIAGQPIGIAGGNNYEGGQQVRFFVYYLPKGAKLSTGFDEKKTQWNYIPLKFWVNGRETVTLEAGKTYTSEHPLELITKELSKREKAKLDKSK